MIASNAAARSHGNTGVIARLLESFPRLFPPHWPLFRLGETSPETVVARHGAVEIRRTRAGLSAQTRVKGEFGQARSTALRRLAIYVGGDNRCGTPLGIMRPVVQRLEAPGRWQVCIGVDVSVSALIMAASPQGRIRIRAVPSELLAVLRLTGCPSPLAIERGKATIIDAIVNTEWTAAGEPMIRLHRPPAILPFANRFEVAVPITDRRHDASSQHGVCRNAAQHLAARKRPT
jgi:hypothetical protein